MKIREYNPLSLNYLIANQIHVIRSLRYINRQNRLQALSSQGKFEEAAILKKTKFSSETDNYKIMKQLSVLDALLHLRRIIRIMHKEMITQSPEYKSYLSPVSSEDLHLPKFLASFLYPKGESKTEGGKVK